MVNKAIKISEENYQWLLSIATELQRRYKKPVSFDEALLVLRNKKMEKGNILDLAGRWKMSDKEAEKFVKDVKKGWKKWKIPSV